MKHLHYGWVMVFSAAGVLLAHAIIIYSFGIFLRPITMEFGWDRGALSAAVSMGMLISGTLSILTGRLSDKYGPRVLVSINGLLTGAAFFLMSQINSLWHVYLIYGVLMPIGSSCGMIPLTTTIPRWFTKRRGIAMGLTWSGFGLGGIISPILSQWLISNYGWRWAYMTLGIIVFIFATLLAQLLKQSPQRMKLSPYGENGIVETEQVASQTIEGLSLKQAIKTSRFWVFGLILSCFIFIHPSMMSHLAPHAVDIGIAPAIAASFVSIFAATSLISTNLSGFMSDKLGARFTMSVSFIMMTLVLIWLLFSSNTWMLYLFAILYGIPYGGFIPLQTLMAGELFGIKFLGMITASIMLVGQIGGVAGPPLAGSIFDITGSYRLAFIIFIILAALAAVFSIFLLRPKGEGTQYPADQHKAPSIGV